MQMRYLSSSLSVGGLIFYKALNFSGSGFTPSEVNSILKNFISDLPKIHSPGFKVRFAFGIAPITLKIVSK